jgi:hypothetical protein
MMQEEAKLKAKYPNVKPGGPSGLLAKRLQRGVSLFLIHSRATDSTVQYVFLLLHARKNRSTGRCRCNV